MTEDDEIKDNGAAEEMSVFPDSSGDEGGVSLPAAVEADAALEAPVEISEAAGGQAGSGQPAGVSEEIEAVASEASVEALMSDDTVGPATPGFGGETQMPESRDVAPVPEPSQFADASNQEEPVGFTEQAALEVSEAVAVEGAVEVSEPGLSESPEVAQAPTEVAGKLEASAVEGPPSEMPETTALLREPPSEVRQVEAKTAEPEASAVTETMGVEDDDRHWYVVHCYSGYENKVRHNLEQRIESMGMKDKIFDVVVPTEEEIEVKEGKRRTVERRVFPGYILVQMIMTEESWYVVRNTPGVTGFVGMGNEPTALRPEEVAQIIRRMEAEAPRVKVTYKIDQKVRIIDGPFNDFIGTVDYIDMERAKVRVMVSFFGRETPVELDFLQVEKA